MNHQSDEMPLFVGKTPDGRPVSLSLGDSGGSLRIDGETTVRISGSSRSEVAKIVKAFGEACGYCGPSSDSSTVSRNNCADELTLK